MMSLLYWRPSVNSLDFLYNQTTALFIDYLLVIPGAVLAVITVLIYGLKTKWGQVSLAYCKMDCRRGNNPYRYLLTPSVGT